MLRGFWKLTWLETKIFMREPMGVIGTLGLPLLIFVVFGRMMGAGADGAAALDEAPFNVPVLVALLITVSAVLSLIAIMAIYREGGILKRLRATPLSPVTILSAHVVVKLIFTILSLAILVAAGRRLFPGAMDAPLLSFTAALLLSTLSVLALGFVVASLVPTARFAQPIGAAIVYPMVALSGLFFPVDQLPGPLYALAVALPTTHAVELLEGVWVGEGWLPHLGNVAALLLALGLCIAISSRVFRWE